MYTMKVGQQAGYQPNKVVRSPVVKATKDSKQSLAQQITSTAIAASLVFGVAAPAMATTPEEFFASPSAKLVKCKGYKKFEKYRKKEIANFTKNRDKFVKDSPAWVGWQTKIDAANESFDSIGDSGRYCQPNGFPVLIADPGLALRTGRASDVLIPGLGFLYFAGWLGWAGRSNLLYIREKYKLTKEGNGFKELPTEWDYGTAFKILAQSWAWPVGLVNEIRNGTFMVDDKYVSEAPRV